ncbi:MAG: AsmA-like C-terminal region-containing protein [Bacteroidia bacterium]|jgi:hypothetical protein
MLPRTKRIIRYALAGLFVLSCTYLLLIFSNREKLKSYILHQINEQLIAKVDVEKIDLSLFSHFPMVSLDFNNIKISEPENAKKTLLSAQHVYIAFNLYDVLLKRYTIRQIVIDSGICNIRYNKKGQANFNIIKQSDTLQSSGILQLKEVHLNRLTMYYDDQQNDQLYAAHLQDVEIGFKREKGLDALTCKGVFDQMNLRTGKVRLIRNKRVETDLELTVDESKQLFRIKKAGLRIDELELRIEGSYTYGKNSFIDLNASTSESSIPALLSILPNSIAKNLNTYKSKGNIRLNVQVKGKVNKKQSPSIEADFEIQQGTLTEPSSKTSFTKIRCKGHFSNGKEHNTTTSSITLNAFSAELEGGQVSGTMEIQNFRKPILTLNIEGKLPFEAVLAFQQNKWIKSAKGILEASVNINGPLYALYGKSGLQHVSSGRLNIIASDLELHNGQKISNFYTDLNLTGNQIAIKTCRIVSENADANLEGNITHVFAYLFQNQSLESDLTIRSTQADIPTLIALFAPDKKDTTPFALPDRLHMQLRFELDQLRFHKFSARQIQGSLRYTPQKLILTDLICETMKGKVKLTGQAESLKNGNFLVSIQSDLNRINLKELFYSCADFGQNEITHKHLNGTLTSKTEVVSVWTNSFDCLTDKLYVSSEVHISNGELNQYQPLESLSKYAKVDDLRNLRFNQLNNHVVIRNRILSIPEMDVANNALNLTLSGTHTFDNIVDYTFKIRLKELLVKKRKAAENEFGEVDETGKGLYLYLSMKGPASNPVIQYNKVAVKQKIQQDLKTEKETIKSVLRKEFGIEKDSLIREKENNSDELEFERD